ncbi:MAG TPA: CDF family Co(II)/Ni(II) efflux transporter DmeF [Clostridia bacterium]|nr:CDF family Co(II)/Ni(II) efflux transporter DmeF [Clostridia bacterium]
MQPEEHSHEFHSGNPMGERRTRWVVALTAVMMVVEISAGWMFGSMALLADGWHMSSHVVALGVTAAAYFLTRHYARDPRFAFGTWKIEILGGFGSAIILVGVALYMAGESIQRLFRPEAIQFDQAIGVAVIGLLVNVISALLLSGHDHGHGHPHDHGHSHGHGHDLNLRAAYLHVLADATTSLLAIVALIGGKFWHWNWLDPVMGTVGASVVSVWAYGLLRDTSRVLLDREMDAPVVQEIRDVLQAGGKTRLCDLHVWQVGCGKFACIASLVTDQPHPPEYYKSLLSIHEEIVHVTIEIHDSTVPATAHR